MNLNVVLRSLISLVTIWISYKYLNIYFEKRTLPTALKWLPWTAFYIYQAYVENHPITSPWISIFNILFVFLISLILYKGSFLDRLIKSILLWILWIMAEYFTSSVLLTGPFIYEKMLAIGSLFSKLLVIFALQIVERHAKRGTRRIPLRYWFLLLLIPASTAYLANVLFQFISTVSENGMSYTPAFLLLLLINVVTFEAYERITQSMDAEAENAVFEQQLASFTMQMEAQKESDENFRREKHDLINQFIVIKSHLECGKTDDALALLSDLVNSFSRYSTPVCQSGNGVVDAIINYKYAIAKNKGISLQMHFLLPDSLSIASRDLCIILGNIMDNAIEASENTRSPYIDLSMEIRRGFLVLVEKNPFRGTLLYDKQGNLLTTKREKQLHGYGLSSVRRVTEKYQGELLIETLPTENTDETLFCLTVYLQG